MLVSTNKHTMRGESKTRLNQEKSYFVPSVSILSRQNSERYSVLGILFLRFLYSSSTIIPRANLPLILEAKYSTSVVSVGYLNSLQALVGTVTGFAVGPVVIWIYKNNSSNMVKGAGILKVVSHI